MPSRVFHATTYSTDPPTHLWMKPRLLIANRRKRPSITKIEGRFRLLADCSRRRGLLLAVVAEPVIVQRHGLTGALAEVRAVVLILVGRNRVRRGAGLLGGLNLDVAVAGNTRTGRDQLADDDVLLETVEPVAAAVDRRIGQHASGLLERRRRQPRIRRERRLRDAHQHRTACGGLVALRPHPTVLGLELRTLGQRTGQELRCARVDDGHATQHLPHDDLDVLVVDRHTLGAVDALHLVDEVLLDAALPLHAENLVRVGRTLHQLLAHFDVIAVGQQTLAAIVVLEHLQPLATRDLVVDHFFATVVGNDRDLVELLALLETHTTGDVRDGRHSARHAGLEQFLHTRQTAGDVLADAAFLLERTHGQLRAGLADGLRGDDADRLTDVDQFAGRHRAAVARRTHAGARRTGQHRTHLDVGDAGSQQRIDRGIAEIVATLDDHVAALVDGVGRQCPRVRRGLDVRIADQASVRLPLRNRGRYATLGAAVLLADDDVLRNVHQTAGQVTRVCGTKRGVGQALTSTVGVDEVLQNRQALAERGLDRPRDELTLRVRAEALHASQRTSLVEGTGGSRPHEGDDRVVLGVVRLESLADRLGRLLPDLDERLVALDLVHLAALVLLLDLFGCRLEGVQDLLLLRRHQHVGHGDRDTGPGGPVETGILELVDGLRDDDHGEAFGQIVDDRSLHLLVHLLVHERVRDRQQLVEEHPAERGLGGPRHARTPALHAEQFFLDLWRRTQVRQPDLDVRPHRQRTAIQGHDGLGRRAVDARLRLILCGRRVFADVARDHPGPEKQR